MPAPRCLTPSLALAYLRELSLDVRAAVVLDAAGEPLAGDAPLASRARTALGGEGGSAGVVRVPGDGETLLAVRTADGCAIAVVAGELAVLTLLAHDLEAVRDALVTA